MFPDSNETCLLPPIYAHLFVQGMRQATGARLPEVGILPLLFNGPHDRGYFTHEPFPLNCPVEMMVLVSILGRIKRAFSM